MGWLTQANHGGVKSGESVDELEAADTQLTTPSRRRRRRPHPAGDTEEEQIDSEEQSTAADDEDNEMHQQDVTVCVVFCLLFWLRSSFDYWRCLHSQSLQQMFTQLRKILHLFSVLSVYQCW